MLGLAFLIISSIIGAGFATGAELVVFFGNSTLPAWVIALLVGVVLLTMFGIIIFLNEKNFHPPKIFFIPIYFVFFVAMTAGITQIASHFASILALILSVLVVLYGFKKMSKFNYAVMIFVLVILLITTLPHIGQAQGQNPNSRPLILNLLIYAGLNCCLLFPLFKRARKEFTLKQLLASATTAAITISFFILIILSSIDKSGVYPMPILTLSNNFLVVTAILLCMFTSMFISLFNIEQSTKSNAPTLVLVSAFAFGLSLLGFTQIVSILYPVLGFAAFFLVVCCFVLQMMPRRIPLSRVLKLPRP